jgi:hypothetical protein
MLDRYRGPEGDDRFDEITGSPMSGDRPHARGGEPPEGWAAVSARHANLLVDAATDPRQVRLAQEASIALRTSFVAEPELRGIIPAHS